MTTVIAEKEVLVNEEGYMTDLGQWTPEIAVQISKDEGIILTDRHWDVIKWIQEQHRNQVSLSIRKVGKSGVTDIKEFYSLFPSGPLKKASKIAGIPKPASCI